MGVSNLGTVPNGAFTVNSLKANTYFSEVQSNENEIAVNEFYASLSNPLYGASSSVQPPSIQLLMIIKS